MFESIVLTIVLAFLSLLELARAILHAVKPYESHTKVSGMADAVNA